MSIFCIVQVGGVGACVGFLVFSARGELGGLGGGLVVRGCALISINLPEFWPVSHIIEYCYGGIEF